jgi:hypothetical protein
MRDNQEAKNKQEAKATCNKQKLNRKNVLNTLSICPRDKRWYSESKDRMVQNRSKYSNVVELGSHDK